MEETERGHWEVQWYKEELGSSQGSVGGFEGAGWQGSSSALPSAGSILHRKLALCPFTAASVYSPVLLSLLRGGRADSCKAYCCWQSGRQRAGHIEIITSAAHACSSPSSNKTKDLYKTRLALWPVLVGGQWIPVSYHRQNWQSNHGSNCLPCVHEKLTLIPNGPAQTEGEAKYEVIRGVE